MALFIFPLALKKHRMLPSSNGAWYCLKSFANNSPGTTPIYESKRFEDDTFALIHCMPSMPKSLQLTVILSFLELLYKSKNLSKVQILIDAGRFNRFGTSTLFTLLLNTLLVII